MALPTTVGDADTSMPNQNYYCGPFKSSGGNFYLLTSQFITATNNVLRIFKATDPTDSFTAQDTGNAPEINNTTSDTPVLSAWVFQVGDVLHLVYWDANGDAHRYITFSMATDLWGTELTIETPTNAPTSASCSVAVRDDGDVIVLYNGDTDRLHGTDYNRVDHARKENGTFATVGQTVDDNPNFDQDHWFGSVVVKGSSDRMHFFFKNDDLNDAFQRTLTSANVIENGTFPTAGDTFVDTINHVFGPGISYDDDGTQRVRCPYRDSTLDVAYAEFDSVDAPGAFTINAVVSDNDVDAQNDNAPMCLSVDETDEHLLYSEDVSLDLFHDKNDGTDTEELDAVTINRISCNVYDRSGAKLAYVYDDGGTIKYNEVDLEDAGFTALSDAGFPLRNYYVGPFKS